MLPELTTMATAALAVFLAIASSLVCYAHFRAAAKRLWVREQRLPEATKFEHLQARIVELQDDLERLKDSKFDAEQVIEEAERQRKWIDETKEQVKQLESDQQELERLGREIETKQTVLAELEKRESEQQGELQAISAELDRKRAELEENAALLEKQQEDAARLAQVEQQLAEAERRRNEAVQAAEKLDAEYQRRKSTYESDLREMRKELESLLEAKKRAENDVAALADSLNSLRREKSELEGEISGLKSSKGDLKDIVTQLQGEQARLQQAVGGKKKSEASAASLWRPVLKPASQTSSAMDEMEAIARLQQHLSSCGLRYSERAIDAFHTSLKTTESSPLVVLAGVSGTGKSELPRRYAEALGLNFLNVSVQPRWDGPQDLFGFFDYLEGSFRATDLTRALLQMDPVGPEDGRGWPERDDWQNFRIKNQLLLVLLDEMNLARVEYYFSEFLSRLESRRGLELQPSKDQRASAEISLDIGGGGEASLLRMFVGRNVLFVGTMNEDETTQALSDKVVDRANVLRFGSPADLDLPGAGLPAGDEKLPALSWKTWNSWYRPLNALSSGDREMISGWIKKLHGAMNELQRPFAYRVSKSIMEYAANYPRREEWQKLAMADQIEQKILPRLRGVDPQDPQVHSGLSTIADVIRAVGDTSLAGSFNDCRNGSFFQWTGLDRPVAEAIA